MKRKNLVRLISVGLTLLLVLAIVMLFQSNVTNESVSESIEQYQMIFNGEEPSESYVEDSFSESLETYIDKKNYGEVEGFFVDSYLEDVDLEYISHEEEAGKIIVKVKVNSIYLDSWRNEFSTSLETYLPEEVIAVIKNESEVDKETKAEYIGQYWVEYSNFLNNHSYINREVEIELDNKYRMSEDQFDKLMKELFNS